MAATAIHRLTLDPMGKCSNAFFSETTNIIRAKLYMNVHWVVLYKLHVFCSGMKFKMAATAGIYVLRRRPSWISDLHKKHIFCRGPSNDHSWAVWFQLSKWFQRRSVLKAATVGHRLTLDPMGECSNAFFSETTNIIKAKLYMNVHWVVLYKLYVFCSDMKFIKSIKFVEDLPMIIPGQFGFHCSSSFREEAF
jgi:hypothetical protein